MARVSSRPSSSGSTTFMARSAGDRPRAESRQASRALPDSTTCSTGTSAASSTVVSSSRSAEKAVVLRMIVGPRAAISCASAGSDRGILQAAHATLLAAPGLARSSARHQRRDRRDIAGHQRRSGRRRPARRARVRDRLSTGDADGLPSRALARSRQAAASPAQQHSPAATPSAQASRRVGGAAFAEAASSRPAGSAATVDSACEPRIGPVVARQAASRTPWSRAASAIRSKP